MISPALALARLVLLDPQSRIAIFELIESLNVFEGQRVSPGDGALRDPRNWRHLPHCGSTG